VAFPGRRALFTWLALACFVVASVLAIHRGRHYDDLGSKTCDFIAPYSGARCLLAGCDPYDPADLQPQYVAARGDLRALDARHSWNTLLPVYPPSTFLLIAPFTAMDYPAAQWAWLYLGAALFCVALGLLAELVPAGMRWAFFLLAGIAITNANQDFLFGPGNPSIYALAFTMLAAWAFFRPQKLAGLGVLSLALGLAMKPHMAIALWMFLLLRKRLRWQSLAAAAIAVALLLGAAARLQQTTGHQWAVKFQQAVAGGIQPGGTNEPSPANPSAMHILNVQSIVSLWLPQPRAYNRWSFLLVGAAGLCWLVALLHIGLRQLNSTDPLLAMAGLLCLSLLPIYHRDYDGRLLLLTVPPMVLLLRNHRWMAVTLMAVSVPVLFSQTTLHAMHYLQVTHHAPLGPWGTLFYLRQQPLALLLLAFLWPVALVVAARPAAD